MQLWNFEWLCKIEKGFLKQSFKLYSLSKGYGRILRNYPHQPKKILTLKWGETFMSAEFYCSGTFNDCVRLQKYFQSKAFFLDDRGRSVWGSCTTIVRLPIKSFWYKKLGQFFYVGRFLQLCFLGRLCKAQKWPSKPRFYLSRSSKICVDILHNYSHRPEKILASKWKKIVLLVSFHSFATFSDCARLQDDLQSRTFT